MKETILYSTSVNDLKEILREVIKSEMGNFGKNDQPSNTPQYGDRKEVGKRLNLSLVTVDKYTKLGILKGYRIGGRIRYKLSEIDSCLEEIRNVKYRRK